MKEIMVKEKLLDMVPITPITISTIKIVIFPKKTKKKTKEKKTAEYGTKIVVCGVPIYTEKWTGKKWTIHRNPLD